MIPEFFTYIYCSLRGYNQIFSYILFCGHDWNKLLDLFKTETQNKENFKKDIYITISTNEIDIVEFYESGVRYKGSNMILNNKAHTLIRMDGKNLVVKTEIFRVFESRIITNLFILLALIFSISSIIGIINFIRYDYINTTSIILTLFMTFVVYGVLLLLWILSREKLIKTKRMIRQIIEK